MTQQPSRSGADLIGEFQRWIVRSGARSVRREASDQLRSAFGRNDRSPDVWEHATADAGEAEAPECAWCPVCRAARVLRESGPGVTTQVAAASDGLAALIHDALSVVESVLASTGHTAGEAEPNGVREQAVADSVQHQEGQDLAGEPHSAGSPGGLPDEPDHRD